MEQAGKNCLDYQHLPLTEEFCIIYCLLLFSVSLNVGDFKVM